MLTFTLGTWVEKPLTTSALFFIPRTVPPAFWWGLSRNLVELTMVYPLETPLFHLPLLPIPIIVLNLGPHHCSLSDKDRLEQTPDPANAFWQQEQKALLHNLPLGKLSEYGDPLLWFC
jgi:hypothetical protein